jgi:DNA-binding MarR family transcriptional regulator
MTASPADPLERDLMDGLVQTSFEVMAALNRVGARYDLSLTQVRLLGVLRDRRPGVTDLARHLGLDKSTVSGLVDRAARRGLVERVADPVDRRSVRVVLSDRGRELARTAEDELAQLLAPLTGRLSPAEQRRTQALLARMLA